MLKLLFIFLVKLDLDSKFIFSSSKNSPSQDRYADIKTVSLFSSPDSRKTKEFP